MSRYIDADELKRNHMFYHEADNRSYAEERDIDETPTVDAVPVEWIKNYIKRTEDNGNTFAAVQYEMMLWDYIADGERRTDEQQ